MSETFGRASGSRKYSVVVLGLAILCCAVMVPELVGGRGNLVRLRLSGGCHVRS